MPRQRIDVDDVIETALDVVDEGGVDDLALARVADDLGVQSSALYNHVEGLDGLRHQVAVRASGNLADALLRSAVAKSGEDAVRAIAFAYRQFALDHPGQHASTLLVPAEADDDLETAQRAIVDVIARVLESCGLVCEEATRHASVVWSAIHGFVALEATESFPGPSNTDETLGCLIELVLAGLPIGGR